MKGYLPEQSHISQVHLRTADLERAREFYSGVLGLNESRRSESEMVFGETPGKTGPLLMSEDRNASPRPPRAVGLYHLALRYETRGELAQAYQRLVAAGYPISGAADHGVSEAIYLSDPEGNGVELYTDRPRSEWPRRDGQLEMVTTALDFQDLLANLPAVAATDAAPRPDLGHIHLQVADLRAAEKFFSEFLGLAVTQRTYPGALFFAAGDYHHHVAANTWAGKTVPPADSVGLISYRLEVPVAEILYCLKHRAPLHGYETRMEPQPDGNPILQIRDPNGNWLEVQGSGTSAGTGKGLPEGDFAHCGR